MPWGKGEQAQQTKAEMLAELRKVNAKARKLHELHIKKILKGDFNLLNGVLAYRAIDHFGAKEKLYPVSVLLLLVMDSQKYTTARDIYMYGLVTRQQHLNRLLQYLKKWGFVETNTAQRNKHYFLTLKGQNIVKEFKEFYIQRTKEIIKSNAKGNRDIIYSNATIKAKDFA